MASNNTPQHRSPNQNHPSAVKLKPLLLYSSSILIVILAFSLRDNFKIEILKSTLLSHHTVFHRIQAFLHLIGQRTQKTLENRSSTSPYCVLWMAPFLSGGGYSSEAWSYILALHEHMKNPRFKLAVEQHGDLASPDFWEGLPENMRTLGFELYHTQCRINETIVVCHSEPGAWYPPLFETLPCPPSGYGDFMAVVGRTMFETDRVNAQHVKRCNQMDLVWVPTGFHVSTFIRSGVDPSKVMKIVQPIDANFFDPFKYKPLDLASSGNLVLGTTPQDPKLMEKEFVFLSIFKWEYRKGWDVLLKAYLQEFSKADRVALYLLTNPYHSDRNFGNKIMDFVEGSDIEKPIHGWAPVYVIDTHVTQADLPRVYKAADSFVLSSRGEGWGRPIVEAMAMSLPVIVTNWSGPTEYLTEQNGYPLPVEKMSEVTDGPFKNHHWAEPSVDKLRILMRHVMSNLEEARAKGRKAREDMTNKFSPEIVAGILTDQITSIISKRSTPNSTHVP